MLCDSHPRMLIHMAIENLEVGRVPKMLKGDIKKIYLLEGVAQPLTGMEELGSNEDRPRQLPKELEVQ